MNRLPAGIAVAPGDWLTLWRLDAPVVSCVVAVSVGYLLLAQRRPGWPLRRTACLLAAAVVVIVATCSALGAYDHVLFWALSAQDVLLVALAPVPLVLSRPLQLLRPGRRARSRGGTALLGSVVAVAALSSVYATGLDQARLEHRVLFCSTQLLLVAAGCCFAGPLFAERGANYGVRTLIAFVDGLLDAVPGLVVLGAHGTIAAGYYAQHVHAWGPAPAADQRIGGSLMIALGELVGLPALLLTVARWTGSDRAAAELTDVALDARAGATPTAPATGRPWWETDPGPLSDRAERERW